MRSPWMTELVDVSRIRDLNDQLRRSLTGGMLVMTKGIIALGAKRQMAILSAIAAFNNFYQPALIIMHWPSRGGRWT
jgi:hypothetical protein